MAAEQGIGTFGAVIDAHFSTGQGAGLKSKREQLEAPSICLCVAPLAAGG